MAGHVPPKLEAPDPIHWRSCRPYLYGIDLLNHGYYWEAHEAWESLWNAAGRGGLVGDFLKGLIKLAAAGVKAREGRRAGVVRHARRAEELFASVPEQMKSGFGDVPSRAEKRFMGLSIEELTDIARRIAVQPPGLSQREPVPPVKIVFDFCLAPR